MELISICKKMTLIACILVSQALDSNSATSAVPLNELMADTLQAYDGGRYDEAFEGWNDAADQGNTDAMVAIANMYRQGEGRTKQLRNAALWYEKAAKLGNLVGQMNYGEMLEKGIGIPINKIESYVWYGLAGIGGSQWAKDRQRALANRLSVSDKRNAELKIKRQQQYENK